MGQGKSSATSADPRAQRQAVVREASDGKSRQENPGVDGQIWSSPAAKWKGMLSMRHRGYRALPLRRVYVPKSNGKRRPLGIPCMPCRAMQALWKLALEPAAESLADPNSYGFRQRQCNTSRVDTATQPDHSRMGHGSPPRRSKSDLLLDRLTPLEPALAVGSASTPHERRTVDQRAILPR